jgi:hypothetical protein
MSYMKDLGWGKRASDELEGKVSDKQGKTYSIIETNLGYRLNLDLSPAGKDVNGSDWIGFFFYHILYHVF